jgi:hypothetical protein
MRGGGDVFFIKKTVLRHSLFVIATFAFRYLIGSMLLEVIVFVLFLSRQISSYKKNLTVHTVPFYLLTVLPDLLRQAMWAHCEDQWITLRGGDTVHVLFLVSSLPPRSHPRVQWSLLKLPSFWH